MSEAIRYDILVQEALRGMVRDLLTNAARKGLPGDHHFFITFDTSADGVRVSDRLREQYPDEMTVVLQYQFRDLKVTDKLFEVVLTFGGVPERLCIPFSAIKSFADPSVQFALQFESLMLPSDNDDGQADKPVQEKPSKSKPRTSVPASPLPAAPAAADKPGEPAPPPGAGAEVVRLDRFRKK